MADNIAILDANSNEESMRTKEQSAGHVPYNYKGIPAILIHGHKTVDSITIPETLGITSLEQGVTVKALNANDGLIYVGYAGFLPTNGFELAPGQEIFIAADSLSDISIIPQISGEGVCYIGG